MTVSHKSRIPHDGRRPATEPLAALRVEGCYARVSSSLRVKRCSLRRRRGENRQGAADFAVGWRPHRQT